MTIAKALLAGLAASMLTLAFNGDTFGEKFNSLPQPVRQTAEAHMNKALPVSISSAQGKDGWEYQINTRLNGKYHDLVINEAGKLVAVKDETDLGSIPATAKAAIEKQAAASKILSLDKVTEGSDVSYGAVMKDDAQGTFVKIRVAGDGTVISKGAGQ